MDKWLSDFDANHRNIINAPIYWPSTLFLLIGIVCLFACLPIPHEFIEISPILNWGSLLLLVAIVYYCIISIPLAIGMLPFISIIFVLQVYLQSMTEYALIISILLTVASVVGICTGHYKEERLKLVLKDIQLVIIAPLWLLSLTYRRLGIPY